MKSSLSRYTTPKRIIKNDPEIKEVSHIVLEVFDEIAHGNHVSKFQQEAEKIIVNEYTRKEMQLCVRFTKLWFVLFSHLM